MKNLFEALASEILYEGRTASDVNKAFMAELKAAYGAVLTMTEKTMPFGLSMVKTILQTRNEFKLTAFFNQCLFFEAVNPHPSLDFHTAGVIPYYDGTKSKTIFIYDREWIDSLIKYFQDGKEISEAQFKKLYAEDPRNPSLSYELGELLLLFAHESMHIFRSHGDRSQRQNKDHKSYNIAADMVINYTLANKIKKIGGIPIKMPEGGWTLDKNEYTAWLKKKSKFLKDESNDDGFNRNLNADVTYDYYLEKFKQNQPKQPPKPAEVGSLRKIKNGEHKGKFVRVKSMNDDGTMEVEIVDIHKEKAREQKARGIKFARRSR